MAAASLSIDKHVLPVLAAYESQRLWGSVVVVFEDGKVANVELYEKMRMTEQVMRWLRRLIHRRPEM